METQFTVTLTAFLLFIISNDTDINFDTKCGGGGSTINVVFFSLFNTWIHWWSRRLFELLKWLGNDLIWDQNFIFYLFMFKLVYLYILNYWPNVKLQKRYREKYSLLYQQSRSLIFVLQIMISKEWPFLLQNDSRCKQDKLIQCVNK